MGVRGEIEGFSTFEMSFVMSAYFVGFLGGSRMAPGMIRRVGHVRVFAALASFISAVMILYPVFTNPVAWSLGRVIIGFCFSGVYVTAESWLNNAASNENRGQALSLYMIVQMVGIVAAQALLLVGDPAGFETFVIASVLISISFAPILLSISPTPAFDTAKPMSLRAAPEDLAARLRRHVPAGRRVLGAVRHDRGLWRRGRAEPGADLDLRRHLLYRRAAAAIPAGLDLGPHGPARC